MAEICCSYPPSLLRIISSLPLFIGDGGLQQFLDSDAEWRFKYPATFISYINPDADMSALFGRPNFFESRVMQHCKAFALFNPLVSPTNHQVLQWFNIFVNLK